jgi:hypothetical protein
LPECLVRSSVQRATAPPGEGVPQQALPHLRFRGMAGLPEQPPELVRVDQIGIHLQHVPTVVRGQLDPVLACPRPGKHASDTGYLTVDDLARPLGWIVLPEEITEPVNRHRAASLQQEDCQHQPLLAARQPQRPAVVGKHLHRAEHVESHVHPFMAAARHGRTLAALSMALPRPLSRVSPYGTRAIRRRGRPA